jgi:hypothetical protein
MKVIIEFVTRGVTILPLKRNLIPRFEKRGAARNRYDKMLHWQDRKSRWLE